MKKLSKTEIGTYVLAVLFGAIIGRDYGFKKGVETVAENMYNLASIELMREDYRRRVVYEKQHIPYEKSGEARVWESLRANFNYPEFNEMDWFTLPEGYKNTGSYMEVKELGLID